MKHPKQYYGVFHKKPTVVDGRVYKGPIFMAPTKQDCVSWVGANKNLLIKRLNN